MNDRLQGILADVRRRLAERKARVSEQELRRRCAERAPALSLAAALRRDGPLRVLGELKRRSPSAGSIYEQLDVAHGARELAAAGCAALSVLTEQDHFGGSLDALIEARASVELPLLRKDFLVEPYQLVEARACGADAVLLLAAVLDDAALREMAQCAQECGLSVLAEAHGEEELQRLVELEFPILGLNARDLRDFSVDLDRVLRWARSAPEDRILVAESGVRSVEDARRIAASRCDAVLIGEALMRGGRPAERMRELFGAPS